MAALGLFRRRDCGSVFTNFIATCVLYVFWCLVLCWINTACGRWYIFIWIFTLSARSTVVLVNVWPLKWFWGQVESDRPRNPNMDTPWIPNMETLAILGNTLITLGFFIKLIMWHRKVPRMGHYPLRTDCIIYGTL